MLLVFAVTPVHAQIAADPTKTSADEMPLSANDAPTATSAQAVIYTPIAFAQQTPPGADLPVTVPEAAIPRQSGDTPPPVGSEAPPLPDVEQTASAGRRTVFTPADFARFAPRNALDMVQNVPGFEIEREEEARGLGQASGNVLINGERAAGKSESAELQLARIPAASVTRIELVDGSTMNIPGLSGQVVNVVARLTSGGPSGRFEWRPQLTTGPAPLRWSQGDISIAGNSGALGYTVALRNMSMYNGSEGTNLIVDATGVLDPLISTTTSTRDEPTLSIALRYDLGGGTRANLNLSGGLLIYRQEENEFRTDPARPRFDELINTTEDGYNYEISGDVEFPFGPGQLKLIGLERYDDSDRVSESRETQGGGVPTGRRVVRGSGTGERIGRGEYRWQLWGAEWQLSLEAAFNRLANTSALFTLNPAGEFVPTPFPSGSGGVREDRYESILSYSRPLAPDLSLQLAVGGEYSTIAQTGANALSRTFKRPKGSLNLAWATNENFDLSLLVARRVGQLSFGDFLASVNLSEGNTNAGNNQLRPQQSWEFELEGSYDFGAWGSATVMLFHHMIEDFITIIPILGGGESRGNLESGATNTGIEATGTLRLDLLGISGARVDIGAELERSQLTDPVTGLQRAFDRSRASEIELAYRHDIPQTDWAYGGSIREIDFLPYYRVTEEGLEYNMTPRAVALFVEHKDVLGLRVKVELANLLGSPSFLDRSVFEGPRGSAPLRFRETRERDGGTAVRLTVAGTF